MLGAVAQDVYDQGPMERQHADGHNTPYVQITSRKPEG